MRHLKPNGTLLSAFGYAYNPASQIVNWTNQADTLPERVWAFAYDAANQLTNAVLATNGGVQNTYTYAYDPAGNRVQDTVNEVGRQLTYNALNELNAVSVGVTNAATYEWDAEHRLTAINSGTNRSEFAYDGLGQRVRIIEKTNGAAASTRWFLWVGAELREVRDGIGAGVLRRLYPQGESLVGPVTNTNLFYARDHLGSIRDATDASGALAARYNYDPFGRRTVLYETLPAALGYTGHFFHASSGLNLTFFRALDTDTGRWLSRDPLKMAETAQGPNLYLYVQNDPINLVDPQGDFVPILAVLYIATGYVYGTIAIEYKAEIEDLVPTAWKYWKKKWDESDVKNDIASGFSTAGKNMRAGWKATTDELNGIKKNCSDTWNGKFWKWAEEESEDETRITYISK